MEESGFTTRHAENSATKERVGWIDKGWKQGKGVHLCDECIHAARDGPRDKSFSSHWLRSKPSIPAKHFRSFDSPPLPTPHPPPVKRAAKERLNSQHVHKCTERRIIELSLTRLVGPRRAFPCPRWKTTPGNVGPRPDGNDNLQRLCDPSTGTVQHFSHFLRCKGVITKLYNCATLRNFYSNKERLPLANLLMGKCCNTGCNSDCTLYYVLYTIYSILY